MKKLIALILAFALLLSFSVVLSSCDMIDRFMNTYTEDEGTKGLDFYPLPDGTYGVKVGKARYLEDIVIPAKYNGKEVTKILELSFNGSENLKSITIPDSVTSIGYCAFDSCTSLTEITIPESVTIIERNAFWGCTNLENVTLGKGVESIGDYAFHDCTSLEEITIPDSVTSIGEYAFHNCTSLTSINFNGTEEEWYAISKGRNWNSFTANYRIHFTEEEIAE